MSHLLGIAIESLVAVLLVLTIGYCMLLNSRLKRLKADESSLKATIAELITATEIAERAIGRPQAHRARRQRQSRQPAELGGGNVAAAEEAAGGRRQRAAAAVQDRAGGAAGPGAGARKPRRYRPPRQWPRRAQAFSERRRSNGLAA